MKRPVTFLHVSSVTDPLVVRKEKVATRDEYFEERLTGTYYRFKPDGWRQIAAVQMLDMGQDRFAFAAGHGHGICLSSTGLDNLSKALGMDIQQEKE